MSPRQLELLEACEYAGGLWRWPGGWWCPIAYSPEFDRGKPVPANRFYETLVLTMLEKKHLEVAERMPRGDPCKVIVLRKAA